MINDILKLIYDSESTLCKQYFKTITNETIWIKGQYYFKRFAGLILYRDGMLKADFWITRKK